MKKRISKKNNFKSKIITGDVIKILTKIPNKLKFELIIADPPYNIGKNFGNNSDNMDIKNMLVGAKNGLVNVSAY